MTFALRSFNFSSNCFWNCVSKAFEIADLEQNINDFKKELESVGEFKTVFTTDLLKFESKLVEPKLEEPELKPFEAVPKKFNAESNNFEPEQKTFKPEQEKFNADESKINTIQDPVAWSEKLPKDFECPGTYSNKEKERTCAQFCGHLVGTREIHADDFNNLKLLKGGTTVNDCNYNIRDLKKDGFFTPGATLTECFKTRQTTLQNDLKFAVAIEDNDGKEDVSCFCGLNFKDVTFYTKRTCGLNLADKNKGFRVRSRPKNKQTKEEVSWIQFQKQDQLELKDIQGKFK